MKLSAVVVLLVVGANSPAMGALRSPVFTLQQKQAIVYAYQIGGLDLAAIIYQESSACTRIHNPKTTSPIGCGQLHQDTADVAAGHHVSKRALVINWRYNIRLAAKTLRDCQAEFGEDGGITCYEVGAPAARGMTKRQLESSDYLHVIERRIAELKALPLSTDP